VSLEFVITLYVPTLVLIEQLMWIISPTMYFADQKRYFEF